MIDKRPDQPYASALDIHSYRDMYMQLRAVKPLLLFSPKMRRQMKDIENKLRYLARTVDEFYDLFGPRHLVFHGQLNPEDIGPLLKLPVEEAERNLIGLYKITTGWIFGCVVSAAILWVRGRPYWIKHWRIPC
jgi:hypothetical protein